MKIRAILAVALAAGMISLLSSEAHAFNRFGRGASCGCDVTPSCGCDMTCCDAAPTCCDPCCDPCCKPKREGFLKKLFNRCKKSSCCEPACGCDIAPSCGCDMAADCCTAAPSCGCDAPACCDPCCDPCKKRGGFLKKLFSGRKKASCCEPACGCDIAPACGCDIAPSCGCN